MAAGPGPARNPSRSASLYVTFLLLNSPRDGTWRRPADRGWAKELFLPALGHTCWDIHCLALPAVPQLLPKGGVLHLPDGFGLQAGVAHPGCMLLELPMAALTRHPKLGRLKQ